MIVVKSPREIELMAIACRIAAETLEKVSVMASAGVKTRDLDSVAYDFIRGAGAKPAFKGYRGYPATLCVSVNDEVIHGIPSLRSLKNGDLISLDVGVLSDGYYGDSARTVIIGAVTPDAEKLVSVTREALYAGIAAAKVGNRVSDISNAVQTLVEKNGFSVVREFVGHGIGRKLHEDPQIPNYGEPGRGALLKPGMTLAIEPMVNAGRPDVRVLADKWTAVTLDGSLSAHFEHTVAVTENGPRILTYC
jgi:methionyl aminopeptidase